MEAAAERMPDVSESPLTITADMLAKLGARSCDVAAFRAEWPDGAPATPDNVTRALGRKFYSDWLFHCLLTDSAWAAYENATDSAWAAYEKDTAGHAATALANPDNLRPEFRPDAKAG